MLSSGEQDQSFRTLKQVKSVWQNSITRESYKGNELKKFTKTSLIGFDKYYRSARVKLQKQNE